MATAFLLASLPALRLAGASGHDFAGSYRATDATQSGDTYTLTFAARVFNYSGADIADATVSLNDSIRPGRAYEAFPGISIESNGNARVSASVTIPAREYEHWQRGASPLLTIKFADIKGNKRLARVELVLGPVAEEE